MEINWIEWLGYLASVIVAISLLMSSIVKLRWYNLIGGLVFSIYGFLIGSLPVGFLNMFIVFTNIYYIVKMRKEKEYFKIIEMSKENEYLNYFLEFYKSEIKKYLPYFNQNEFDKHEQVTSVCILRNSVPAGIFMGYKYSEDTFMITLDFVTPEYRDFKVAKYLYEDNKQVFINKGYKTLCVPVSVEQAHIKYLNKMGFSKDLIDGQEYFIKKLD